MKSIQDFTTATAEFSSSKQVNIMPSYVRALTEKYIEESPLDISRVSTISETFPGIDVEMEGYQK